MYLEQQISILEWFLKNHVTLKTKVMAAENSALSNKGINSILKYMKIKYYFILIKQIQPAGHKILFFKTFLKQSHSAQTFEW